ncbi:MAG: hypothetical protein C0609_02405 [Deltaproteobacteria bacterium]|nr:MAG: hypothetical protein C0609_02405 [Deltaproteobacteria bacterium]
MTGRRWESREIAKHAFAWLAVAVLAVGCATPGDTTSGAAPVPNTAEAAVSTPASAAVVVNSMSIEGGEEDVRIHFGATGFVKHELVASRDSMSVVVKLDDARFEGLSKTTEVGDGTISSIALSDEGEVSVALSAHADSMLISGEAGFTLVIAPFERAAQSAAAQPAKAAVANSSKVRVGSGEVDFTVGVAPTGLSGFVLSDGVRLVIDVEGVALSGGDIFKEYPEGAIKRVIVRESDDKVRAVLEARDSEFIKNYTLSKTDTGFKVLFGSSEETVSVAVAAPSAPEAAPVVVAQTMDEASTPVAAEPNDGSTGGGEITDFGFHQDKDKSYVDLLFSKMAAYNVAEASGNRVVIDMLNTRLPSRFQRALDTSAFAGNIKLIAAYQRKGDTRVVVDLSQPTPFTVLKVDSGLSLAFDGGSGAEMVTSSTTSDKIVLVGGSGEPMSKTETMGSQATGYKGTRISMDFVNADIRNVLRLIGEVSGLNIVTGSEVTGTVTIRLVDVPWDQALEVILKAKGLGKEIEGNIMRVVSAERLDAEYQQVLEKQKAAEEAAKAAEPLSSEIFPVNYAEAGEVLDKITALLSERGSASVDERTNTIIVRDVEEKIELARELVARLDTPTPQVLIEARIVEVSSNYNEDLGIQWGGQYTADASHGNSTGYGFPNSIGIQGSTGAGNYLVNLPAAAAVAGSPGAALAINMGHINDILSLDLRLSALETSGKGRVVSSPRVTTLDNKAAEISQGTEIPFTTISEDETAIESIDYLLALKVTPHVTSDSSIMLKIEIKKDAPSTTYFATDGTPAKETRTANTEVLVRDGETAVIGGIITDSTSESTSGVPWFHKLPFVGWLFKSQTSRVEKTELIIFLTPRIVQLDQTTDL